MYQITIGIRFALLYNLKIQTNIAKILEIFSDTDFCIDMERKSSFETFCVLCGERVICFFHASDLGGLRKLYLGNLTHYWLKLDRHQKL